MATYQLKSLVASALHAVIGQTLGADNSSKNGRALRLQRLAVERRNTKTFGLFVLIVEYEG